MENSILLTIFKCDYITNKLIDIVDFEADFYNNHFKSSCVYRKDCLANANERDM